MLVRAAGEGEELANAIEHAVSVRRGRRGYAARARIDTAFSADPTKRLAVRRLIPDEEHLIDKLVGHLVLEHCDDLGPRSLEHKGSR